MAQVQFPDGSSTTVNDSEPGSRDAAWRAWYQERGTAIPPHLRTWDDLLTENASLNEQLAEALAKIAVYEAPPAPEPEIPVEGDDDAANEDANPDQGAVAPVLEPPAESEPVASESPADATDGGSTVEPPTQEVVDGNPADGAPSEHAPVIEKEPAIDQGESKPEDGAAQDEPPAATPAAVAHAEAVGIPLDQIEGSGADGKITKPDVVAAAAANEETSPPGA